MIRISEHRFRALVAAALDRLPQELADHVREVTVNVTAAPTSAQVEEAGCPPGEPLLGLYDGVPLTERSVDDPARPPDIVHIFRRPHEEICDTLDELEEEIGITLAHEIGHYLGMSEMRLEELGYG